ncbi:MAG TPA: NepR family anti-sigma factor [Salinarimonas sp.]|nr:NepR family anti-sigma factor [Salinarimonas sp.]
MRVFQRDFEPGATSGDRRIRRADNPILERVGKDLRTVYAPLIREPLPGEFAALLRKLEERDTP